MTTTTEKRIRKDHDDVAVASFRSVPSPYAVEPVADPPEKELDTALRQKYTKPGVRFWIQDPPPGWIRWMSWNPIHAGHCWLSDATVYLYPDAQVFFRATTRTSSDGDVCIIRGIQFYDGYGNPVGGSVPKHDGMNMAWEGSEYPFIFWDIIPNIAPSGVAQIRSASMTNHC